MKKQPKEPITCCKRRSGIPRKYGEQLKDDQFIDRLSKVSIREIIRTAKDRHAGTQGYAEALLLQYNKRLKYQLRWSPLSAAHGHGLEESPSGDDTASAYESSVFELEKETYEESGYDYDDEDDEMLEEDEGIPNRAGALPESDLMDNLELCGS